MLSAFPGLDEIDLARRLEPDQARRSRLLKETQVELVPDDLWMYVAPHERPKLLRRRWTPIITPGADCIVIGREHFTESPPIIVFLDIFHELNHIRQRRDGAELFDRSVSYVRRWTEVEAYRFVIDAARAAGVPDALLRDYLKVEWISEGEYRELLETLGVPLA